MLQTTIYVPADTTSFNQALGVCNWRLSFPLFPTKSQVNPCQMGLHSNLTCSCQETKERDQKVCNFLSALNTREIC